MLCYTILYILRMVTARRASQGNGRTPTHRVAAVPLGPPGGTLNLPRESVRTQRMRNGLYFKGLKKVQPKVKCWRFFGCYKDRTGKRRPILKMVHKY